MINFRFHVVSLVAVFLALALGVVVGSTLIDRAIVDALRNRIDTVEANLDDADQANDELRATRDRLEDYIAAAAPWTVEGRLPQVPVVVLAPSGLDGDVLDATVVGLREAGAEVGGVVRFEEAWGLEDEDARRELADALDLASLVPDLLRREALGALSAELTSDDTSRPVLVALSETGFLTLESVGDEEVSPESLGGAGSRAVVVVGSDTPTFTQDVAEPATQDLVARGVPVTVSEVYEGSDGEPERGAALAFVRDDEDLATRVSTVDDLELVQGRVATVLALAELGRGRVGNFGVGSEAQGPLPEAGGEAAGG